MAVKIKKVAGAFLSVLLLLIIGLVCIVFFWLGPTVKLVAEHIGSKALGTPLSIDVLKINPRKGSVHMEGFALANHAAFGRTNAVSLAGMDIELDVGSLFTSTVVVHRVQLESPCFAFEQNEATDNISQFIKNLEEFVGSDQKPPKPEKSEPKTVVVEQLEINQVLFYIANTESPHLDIETGFEQLSLSTTNGLVELKKFHISNPGRLETPHLFTLENLTLQLDPASLYSGTPVIEDVRIIRPYAYLERNNETDTAAEFMAIAQNIAAVATNQVAATTPEEQPAAAVTPTHAAPPVILRNLSIDDIQIQLLDRSGDSTQSRMLAGISTISARPEDGRIQIQNICMPNPEGFQRTNLFHLASLDVQIDPASLFSEQLSITDALLDSPLIELEQTETSGNVSALVAQLEAFIPKKSTPSTIKQPEAPAPGAKPAPIPLDEQPVLLHTLTVTNFLVNLTSPAITNEPSAWALDASSLNQLNPMALLSLKKFLPSDDAKEEEQQPDKNGPMELMAFERLVLQPLVGHLEISTLKVANPRQCANKHLVSIDRFSLDFDSGTINSNTIVIDEVLIDTPRVAYERRILNDNIRMLQEEIALAVSRSDIASPDKEEPAEAVAATADSEAQKTLIRKLRVVNGHIKAKLSVAPSVPIALLDIERNNIGGEDGGASMTDMAAELGSFFYDTIVGAVSGTTGLAGDALKATGKFTLGSLGKLTGLGSGDEPEQDSPIIEPEPEQEIQTQPAVETPKKPRSASPKRRLAPGRLF